MFSLTQINKEQFPIDYTEMATALSRRAGLCILDNYGNNLFFHAAAGSRSNYGEDHSSWGLELGASVKVFAEDSKTVLDGTQLPYSASGSVESSSKARCCNHEDHMNCVVAHGYIWDTVVSVSEPFPSTDIDDPKYPREWQSRYNQRHCWIAHTQVDLTWVEQAVLPTVRTSLRHAGVEWDSDVLWRTFLHDREATGTERLPADLHTAIGKILKWHGLTRAGYKKLGYDPAGQQTYSASIDHTIDWFSAPLDEKKNGVDPEVATKAEELLQEGVDVVSHGESLGVFGWARMLERRICVTEQGFVGSVHQLAKPGDQIAIFESVGMPFLLRQDGSQFRIIGSCYVEGQMDGEAVEEMSNWTAIHIV